MSSQLSFDGLEPQPPTDRLFFALFPDHAAAARVADLALTLRGRHQLKGRPLETDRFHVTLCHLGDYAGLPKDIVAKALEAGANVAATPFRASFDCAQSFYGKPRNRPFVLLQARDSAIETFQQTLGLAMAKAGLGRRVAPYTPHVTLLYDDQIVENHAVDAISWTAREFVLIHSLLGKTTHIPLASWPLV
jgi:2'-5' RNA ligase